MEKNEQQTMKEDFLEFENEILAMKQELNLKRVS